MPWTNAVDIDEMIHAHDILRDIAESTDHIVAAHDPKVLRQYPAPTADLDGFAVRLDVEPRAG